MLIIKIFAIIT